MIRRLSEFDLVRRWRAFAPPLLIELTVALCVVALALAARAGLQTAAPGIVPFALLFPATMVAALLAGWRSGLISILVGGGLTWYLFLPPVFSFELRTLADQISLLLFAGSSGLIVFIAGAFRSSALRYGAESRRQLAEREALVEALRESEHRRELAASAGGVGIWDWRIDTGQMVYSREAKLIYGFAPDEEVTIDKVRALTHPADAPVTRALTERALDPAVRDEAPYEFRILRPDGTERWLYASGRAVFEARAGETVATRYLGTVQDITERKKAEEELAQSEAQLRLAVEAGRMAVWEADARSGRVTNSAELNRILGFPLDATPSLEEVNSRYMPGELERVRGLMQQALAQGEHYIEAEYRYRWPNGDVRWLLIRAELQLDPDGVPEKATGVLLDITDRKRAEERLRLLAREVDHRANNLMAVVQGTVSLSKASGARELKEVIVGRINALARAHQLLSQGRWEGADLKRLVEDEVAAFSLGEAARVDLDGPEVALAPAASQGVAMALHELATNAVKYGALSVPQGRVAVSWSVGGDDVLRLRWVERGGPAVTPPSRRGLGTTILSRALEGAIGGSTRLDWRPDGLEAYLELPLAEPTQAAVSPS